MREHGRLRITPLLLVLLIVETTDLLFAVDSIPAIFGITRDSFIIFTSNIFAILGLRALYFLLAGMMDSFRYLHYGLAAVLAFVGLKMVAEGWLPHQAGTELAGLGITRGDCRAAGSGDCGIDRGGEERNGESRIVIPTSTQETPTYRHPRWLVAAPCWDSFCFTFAGWWLRMSFHPKIRSAVGPSFSWFGNR